MLTWIYWTMVAYFAGLTVWSLYREKKPLIQLTCAMVLVTLLLRLLGVK
ncbi:MAG: hypothetical protein GY856_16745 [bacterium]|nr:hypothetical protein [bacterium]